MKMARQRKQKYLSKRQEEHHSLLVLRTDSNHWSKPSGHYSKDNIQALVTGTTKGKWESYTRKMERHLKYSRLDQAMSPNDQYYKTAYNLVEVPLLDILAVQTEQDFGWMFPSQDTTMELQAKRGLARSMVRACETKEIILNGDQTEDEQRKIVEWHQKRMAEYQAAMPGAPLSLDVEEVRCTLQDVLELAGHLPHRDDSFKLSINPGLERFGQHKDRYVQFPCRTMWGNGITWVLMITILTNPGKFNSFVDLGSLMVYAGWGMRTVNMPSSHTVVCSSVLNKTVSCTDESWGMEWHQLAEFLRVYTLGYVKHGWLLWAVVLSCLLRGSVPRPGLRSLPDRYDPS